MEYGQIKNQDFLLKHGNLNAKPECRGEHMRAYGAKSTMLVHAGGGEYEADAAITEKEGF